MRRLLICCIVIISFVACHHQKAKDPVAISRNGVNIAYTQCGKGDTALLFIHGWCINKEYWKAQMDHFCSRYRVVAIDLPGFGQSGKNRANWSFEEYIADVKEVIERLALKNVVLIGHSMSGDIILGADNEYPSLLAGIVGIDNLHEPASPLSPEDEKGTADFFNMLSASFDSLVNQNMAKSLFQPTTDTAVVKRVMKSVSDADSLIAVDVLRGMSAYAQKEKPLMQGLSHKLFLLNSDVYPINKDSMNKYCSKGYEAELLHGASHYPMIEMPDPFNAVLQKIIDAMGTSNKK